MLKAAPTKPEEPSTLAVLSPYNEQVERARTVIHPKEVRNSISTT
jgi:hypothetical protein